MPIWKRNLWVCWLGMFITGIGISQIAPILPLYIQHLGVSNSSQIAQLSGIAFGVTFVVSAIFSPIWGRAADKVGRKPMLLRASLGMAVVIGLLGFAPNVYILIILRMLLGAITGYSTACTTLIATQTDQSHAGFALGTLSTANIAGSLLGPTIGGFVSETFGMRNVFFMTGFLLLIVFVTTWLFVKETFVREDTKEVMSTKKLWKMIPEKSLTISMFITSLVLTMALYTIEPIVTVYVDHLLKNSSHIALIAGIVFSASGLANILSAPRLGKLSDKVGAHKIMLVSLIAAAIIFIPQAFVKNPWQLMGLRFLLGLAAGGLNPSVNILVKQITPMSITGRVFGFSMGAAYLGVFLGSVLGGQIAAYFSIRYVFFVTSALLFLNAVWVYITVYRKLENKKKLILQGSEVHEIISSK